jgi:hypothetical protein
MSKCLIYADALDSILHSNSVHSGLLFHSFPPPEINMLMYARFLNPPSQLRLILMIHLEPPIPISQRLLHIRLTFFR